MPVRPEDFGGIAVDQKAGPRPEDFGGIAIDQPQAASPDGPSAMDVLSRIPGMPTPLRIWPGIKRGATDLSERFSQLVQRAQPGDVYSGDHDPNMPPDQVMGAAINRYEYALGHPLREDELAHLKTQNHEDAFAMSTMAANAKASRDRAAFNKTADPAQQVARAGTNLAPALLTAKTPGGIAEAGGAAGVFLRALYNAGIGSGIGASEFVQPGESRTENALKGGALQAGTSTAAEGAAQLLPSRTLSRNMNLEDALNTPQAQRNLARYGTDRPFSQLTGDKTIKNIESQVSHYGGAATTAQREANRLATQTGKKLNDVLDEIDPENFTRVGTGRKLASAFNAHYDHLDNLADTTFKGALAEANRATGGQSVIPTDNIRAMLRERIDTLKGMDIMSDDAATELKSLQKFQKQFGLGKLINVNTAQRLLSEASGDAAGSGRMLSDLASEKDRYVSGLVKGALLKDMEKAGTTDKSIAAFRQAREDFGLLKDEQRNIFENAFGRPFNRKVPPSPEEALDAFKRMKPTDKSEWLNTMSKYDPQVRSSVQRAYFKDIFSKSGVEEGTGAGTYPLDMRNLAENWKIDHDFLTLFPDRNVRRQLIDIRKEIRLEAGRLQASGGGQSMIQSGKQAGQIAATAATGNAAALTFGAGWLYNKFAPKQFEKLLLSPDGRSNLLKVLKPASFNTSEVTAAAMYLNRIANEPDQE